MGTLPVEDDLRRVAELANRIERCINSELSGKERSVDYAVTALLAGGHILIEDVPGVGKTTLATLIARSFEAEVRRIQFTSDMLPSDVTGLSVYDPTSLGFSFHPGPIFSNIVIGDEINRASPKTQSALLEAMSERTVTVDGETRPLPEPFFVVATQNPADMAGTFPLPEAQRDRFMIRISLGYPDTAAEMEMLATHGASVRKTHPFTPVSTVAEVLEAQNLVRSIHISEAVALYIVNVVAATRSHPSLFLGASPRATLHLSQMARARAAIKGRSFVSPDDVANLVDAVLAHRVVPRGHFSSAQDLLQAASDSIAEIVAQTPVK